LWLRAALEQLNDAEFGFQLLLEDETESAHTRLVQVASWCSGFGFGFGMGDHATSATRLPEDTEELLLDFQEIAKFETLEDTDGVDADEDGTDQSDVVEIEEFVRVGVLLINEEMRPPPASADNKTVGFDDFDSESDEPRTLH